MDFSNQAKIDIDMLIEYISNNPEYETPGSGPEEYYLKAAEGKAEHVSEKDEKLLKKVPNSDGDYLKDLPAAYDVVKIKDLSRFMPSLPIERVPSFILGSGVLGRCYTGSTVIQIRDDLYGKDFEEVDVHELKHAISPHLSEYQVRFWTRAMFNYTRYN